MLKAFSVAFILEKLSATYRLFGLALCPWTTLINYHKLEGLKQQKFIFAQFWGPEVW